MKARLLVTSPVVCVAQSAGAIQQRVDHNTWLSTSIEAQTVSCLKALRDAIASTSNSSQKVRLLAKTLFAQAFEDISQAEASTKMAKAMPSGLYDQYVAYVVADRYLGLDGVLDWSAFRTQLDDHITERIKADCLRAAGAAAANGNGMQVG